MNRLLQRLNPKKHLVVKLWLQMTTVVLLAVVVLMLVLQLLLGSYFANRSREEAAVSTSMAARAFNDQWNQLVSGFISCFGTQDFEKLLPALTRAKEQDVMQLSPSIQSPMSSMIRQNGLIFNILLINRQDVVFHPFSTLLTERNLNMSLDYDPELFHGITMLPQRESPVAGRQRLPVIAIPITTLGGSTRQAVSSIYEQAHVVLYLLLDAETLDNMLNAYASQGICGNLYLLSPDGGMLNGESESEEDSLRVLARQAVESGELSGVVEREDGACFWQYLPGPGILVANVVPWRMLSQDIQRLMIMIPSLGAFSILMLTLLMLTLSGSFTRPVRKLHKTVTAIAQGTFDGKEPLRLQDELGQLSHAIAEMYGIIQRQMESLKQEQSARSKAELKVITQQINPHFLYNTLEAINMEIYANHTQSASAMIQSLGEFLRIGLSFGSSTITVARELEHVRAYVSIMGNRFGRRLIFTAQADPDCTEIQVPKVILQPLVENAIRHGFHMDSTHSMLQDQFIQVEVHQKNGELQLSVIDNGVGIDLEHAGQMLLADPAQQKHVGLSNVYQRLQMRYGEKATITFESIPYYRNCVCIHIPMDGSEGAEE